MKHFINNFTAYHRRKTSTLKVGDLCIGSDFPIVPQSMTTTDTMDTKASVEQIKRMVDAGCELVRLTAPSINEAQNLAEIKKKLNEIGIRVPIVADIHFTPNAAELAARIVEKVRINPGNYADKKKFDIIEYSDADYQEELDRIRKKFTPLVAICKEYGTAMRIGTNHGSLSDRIMSRYGDTPLGMVESAMEFLRICEDEKYYNIVFSMKSSNTQVMVQAYRLLVKTMNENNMQYPLHLGVTEAGEGNDGRIKSALGIGALLEDGIGDTVRVSLTEEPEFELPVAKKLISRYEPYIHNSITLSQVQNFDSYWSPYEYKRRVTFEVSNFAGNNVPRVIADFSNLKNILPEDLKSIGHIYDAKLDKWHMSDQGADYVFIDENKIDFMLPNGLKAIYKSKVWNLIADKSNAFPLFASSDFVDEMQWVSNSKTLNFLNVFTHELNEIIFNKIKSSPNLIVILESNCTHPLPDLRNAFLKLNEIGIKNPVVIKWNIQSEINSETDLMLHASTDIGSLFIDGFGDGILIAKNKINTLDKDNQLAFNILQAARTRISKTEYISCPSCGRTLFDLQETTAMIRKRTEHLKGIKIAIMGCIVNGPGEMADADYGYVGSGPGKITLYKGKEVVKRSVSSADAVNELIELIRENGDWVEDKVNEIQFTDELK